VKLRGRELYIIAGVAAAVLCAGWYFLLFSPLRQRSSDLSSQLAAAESQTQQLNAGVQRLEAMKKTAPQAQADLIRMKKMLPAELAEPGFIVQLTKTAKLSGLHIDQVVPKDTVLGQPFSVEPIDVLFLGKYFDVEDFLYRLENYVVFRNESFTVTGRMWAVTNMTVTQQEDYPRNGVSPHLQVAVTVHGFIWSPEGTVPGVITEGQ
jgi:hypothetical protein